ncbi:MAG: hypothetical protein ACP5T3_01130 [Candidatus Micrarchaeia archaeon]
MDMLSLYRLDNSLELFASMCVAVSFLAFSSSVLLVLGMLHGVALLVVFAVSVILAPAVFMRIKDGSGVSERAVGAALLAATANVLVLFVLYAVW